MAAKRVAVVVGVGPGAPPAQLTKSPSFGIPQTLLQNRAPKRRAALLQRTTRATTMSAERHVSRVAVVVGVGPGLGACIARRFAKEGFAVALMSRKLETLRPIEESIRAAGGEAISVPADASEPESLKLAVDGVEAAMGAAPEVLVYNAGPSGFGWPPPSFLDMDIARLRTCMDAGVMGAVAASQAVLPGMIKAGKGTILFTGATASLRGGAKFDLGQSLAREFHPQGVHVAHVIIDGQVGSEGMLARSDRDRDSFLSPDACADEYWRLHTQSRTTWTQELDLRPFVEKF